jgi:hypothetical protein
MLQQEDSADNQHGEEAAAESWREHLTDRGVRGLGDSTLRKLDRSARNRNFRLFCVLLSDPEDLKLLCGTYCNI